MPGIGVHTAAGTKLRIGGTGPLVSEAAYVLVGKVVDMGEFGPESELIEFNSMDDRNVLKFKGPRNDGDMTIQLGRDITNDGQNDMIAAEATDFDYNIEIELNDAGAGTGDTPSFYRFRAKVMSWRLNVGAPNSVVGATAVLAIQSGTIVITPAS